MVGFKVLADLAARDLADNDQYGRGAGVCRSDSGGGIVQARTRNHQGYARLSGCARIAVGHVRRAGFMAGGDHAYARFVPQGGDDPGHVYAGDPKF